MSVGLAAGELEAQALTSLTFNAGDAWTKAGLGQAIAAGDYGKAARLLAQCNKARDANGNLQFNRVSRMAAPPS